jgi:hypothetical protein
MTMKNENNNEKQKIVWLDPLRGGPDGHCSVFPEHKNYYVYIGMSRWGYCEECKIRWYKGVSKKHDEWKKENKDIWRENWREIRDYEVAFSIGEYQAIPKRVYPGDFYYFGHCEFPEHRNYYLNYCREQWMICDECKIKWFFGDNLLSSWKDETEE